MTQEEQIKQIAEYGGWKLEEEKGHGQTEYTWKHPDFPELYWPFESLPHFEKDLRYLNPVWVKVYAEAQKAKYYDPSNRINGAYMDYHEAINTGNISAALTAVSDAITWLKEQKK